jgi:hypothetical protein
MSERRVSGVALKWDGSGSWGFYDAAQSDLRGKR